MLFVKDALTFIAPYLPANDSSFVLEHKKELKVTYFQYNWDLNGTPMPCDANRPCFNGLDLIITCTSLALVCCVFVACCLVRRRKKNQYAAI